MEDSNIERLQEIPESERLRQHPRDRFAASQHQYDLDEVLQGADLMFIDALQKKHSSAVGFMPTDQLQKNIAKGKVLIAQDPNTTARIGYVIFNDKYFKREDLGIVYQLNIVPHMQRGLVGASLVKAAFEACPWGVKLFCCWCAQDLAACRFWESIGFVPIAFRAGSRGKEHGGKRKEGRMQIFWQRRINQNDGVRNTGAPHTPVPLTPVPPTPYWYPTETSGGSMKENRIVLPIPPGKHWSDELPFVLPGQQGLGVGDQGLERKALAGDAPKPRARKAKPAAPAARPKHGLWFASPAPPAPSQAAAQAEAKPSKPKARTPRQKNDPKLVAAAREFRDRYLDEVNSGGHVLEARGKYDVSRQLADLRAGTAACTTDMPVPPPHLLKAA